MATGVRAWWGRLPLTDRVERQIAEFFQVVLVGWIILAGIGLPLNVLLLASGGASTAVPPGPIPPVIMVLIWLVWLGLLMFVLAPVIALVLLRRGRFRASVAMATWGLLVGHSVGTYALGVNNASVLVVFQLSIAMAGLLGGRRMLVAVTGYVLALTMLVGYLEVQSPPMAAFFVPPGTATAQGTTLTLGFFVVVTLLVSLLLDRIGSALRGALRASNQREAELQAIQGSLEATIGERTAELAASVDSITRQNAEQARLLREIEEQRGIIRELSVPVLPVSRDTLVMPLVGDLDSSRLSQIQEQALGRIEATRARRLLLDITGVPVVDTQVAQGLVRVMEAARLLGATVALVGIRPEVAQTIVGLGLDLSAVRTYSDLQRALGQTLG